VPINTGFDKEDVIYIYTYIMEYYSPLKRNEIVSLAGKWLALEIMM
jgi:hypothetical protein